MGAAVAVESFVRVLWWLFGGSVGGGTRTRVLLAVRERPRNARQLAEALGLDYTTVRHHLRILLKNSLVVTSGETYGRLYFPSNAMESHWADLEAILEKTGRVRKGGVNHAEK